MPVEPLILRIVKGSELTFDECDGNFTKLRDAHDALEESVLLAVNEDGTLKNAKVGYATDVGSSDAYAVTIAGDYANIAALLGVVIIVRANTTNQGAATLAPNGFAATNVKKLHGLALDQADIVAGKVSLFLYNGTDFQLINPRTESQSNYGVDTGAANAYKIEFANFDTLGASRFQVPEALYAGYRVSIKAANDSSAASTLEIKITSPSTSLIGSIKKNNNQDIIAGDIKANLTYDFQWDGANWQLMNQRARSFRATGIAVPGAAGNLAAPQAHGLGAVPDIVQWRLKNKGNASGQAHGYAVGDYVDLRAVSFTADVYQVFIPISTSTTLDLSVEGLGSMVKKNGSNRQAMTLAQLGQDFDLDVYAAITN